MDRSIMKRNLTFLLALLFLVSCLTVPGSIPVVSTLEPAPTIALVYTATSTPFQPPTETATPVVAQEPTATPGSHPARVLILSIDGFRPDAIELTPMRNLQTLMQAGAYSLVAQTIFPSATLPSHASMLTGLCPDQHGVDWNDYIPERGFANGTDIFDLAHAAGLRTVMVVGKEKLRQLTEPQSTDVFEFINDRDVVIAARVAELIPEGFGLMFVHFPTPDWMGHEYGWLSPEQFSVLFRADEALQTILNALQEAGMREDTLIIITADHGGHDTTHGSRQLEDMTIPWIVAGPGVRHAVLSTEVNTTDTAATVAWALDLPLQPEWDGLPVLEAFGLPDEPHPQPRCP
jgi:predicted AlkP superfamily pyrophosphatase or phosphodiesterase